MMMMITSMRITAVMSDDSEDVGQPVGRFVKQSLLQQYTRMKRIKLCFIHDGEASAIHGRNDTRAAGGRERRAML